MITTEDYIKRCKEKYLNEDYSYECCNFVDWNTKVSIFCHNKDIFGNEHGIFTKDASSFLAGHKCPKCARPSIAYTTDYWVALAKQKYPNMLYDRVNYIDKDTPVIIGCPVHGYFEVSPNYYLHKAKHCCSKCVEIKRKEEKWNNYYKPQIEEIWQDYDYDLNEAVFIGANRPIKVYCPKHGYFYPTPTNILQSKCICGKCATAKQSDKRRSNVFKEIEKAKEIYGEQYDYSLINKEMYVNSDSLLPIICPIHGKFNKSMHQHLSDQGCPQCGRIRGGLNKRKSFDEFVAEANEKYNFRYKYDRDSYEKVSGDVRIFCPKHGWFIKNGCAHLNGQGCPDCNRSRLEMELAIAFEKNNIVYEKQKRFGWLGRQSLDLYIPDANIGIECQGSIHFKPERKYTQEMVDNCQERDKRKKRLCKENNLHLIYYLDNYWNGYMEKDDMLFNNINDLINYVKQKL